MIRVTDSNSGEVDPDFAIETHRPGTRVTESTGSPISGEILTSRVRSIDTLARPISYAGATLLLQLWTTRAASSPP